MRITNVHVQGFRSLMSVEAKLQKYSCLIGKNDCGKSSFLRALQLLFDAETSFPNDDRCKFADASKEIFIQATLEGFEHHEFACNGVIHIRRRLQDSNSVWEFRGPGARSATLRKMSEGILTKQEYKSDGELPAPVDAVVSTAIAGIKGRVPAATWQKAFAALDAAGLVEREASWCLFDKERLPELVQVIMLEAGVQGEHELRGDGDSVFGRVAGILLRDDLRSRPGVQSAIRKLEEEVQQAATKSSDGQWQTQGINQFETILREELAMFDGKIVADSRVIAPKIPSFEFDVQIDIRDEWVTGLEKMGHGLRRSVVFSMLRTHRRLKSEKMATDENLGGPSPLYLFLVEEPELYLHPQAERKRKKELLELSELDDAQVVLCTHSAIFADLNQYKGILRFSRPGRKATAVRGWKGQDNISPSMQKRLAAIYRFNPSNSAMLFADHVILVEGACEKIIVPILAENMEINIDDKETVDCGGNNNFPAFQRILEGFGIRYVAWLDTDQLAQVNRVRQDMTSLGRVILTPQDWEHLTGVTPRTKSEKLIATWIHFVQEQNEPNEATKARVQAAYNWEDYEGPGA